MIFNMITFFRRDWHYPNQCWLLTDITPTSVDFWLTLPQPVLTFDWHYPTSVDFWLTLPQPVLTFDWHYPTSVDFWHHPFIKITTTSPSGLWVASLSPEGSGLDFQYKFTTVISFRSVFVDMFHYNRNPCYQLQTHKYYRYDVKSHEHSIPWRRALWGNNFSS